MTESDVLARAARALREAHTGEREGSGFTRARIMNTRHRERRQRTLRWAILSPLASLLLVGSAWAQSTGKWPVIWKAMASVFVAAPEQKSEPAPSPQARAPRQPQSPAREAPPAWSSMLAADAGDESGLSASPVVQATPGEGGAAGALPTALPRVRAERSLKPSRQRRARPAPAPSPAPSSVEAQPTSTPREIPTTEREPGRDRELSRFRRAHDLHFEGRARDALEAYTDYLREYPAGRFVPEARYAMALDQIKLGNDAAAREALTPFAAGHYAGYRQAEARKLLQALEKK